MAHIPSSTLVNEHEAARMLALRVATLRRWRWSGDGPPHYKIGNAVRYSLAELNAFIEAGRRESTSDPGRLGVFRSTGEAKQLSSGQIASGTNR